MPRPVVKPQAEIIVGSQECADIIGIGRQTLVNLTNKGVLPRHSFGRYDLKKVIPAYIQHLEQELRAARAPSGERSYADSRADLYRVRAEREQLALDKFRGELVRVDAVVKGLQNAYAIMRTLLLGTGSKLAPRLALISSAIRIKEIIDDEHAQVLTEFASAKIIEEGEEDDSDRSGGDGGNICDGGAAPPAASEGDDLAVG